ncbi:P-loop containing nucleoside triphosphate hydrolase protein, partial [Lasiosphaeris hirsuta]
MTKLYLSPELVVSAEPSSPGTRSATSLSVQSDAPIRSGTPNSLLPLSSLSPSPSATRSTTPVSSGSSAPTSVFPSPSLRPEADKTESPSINESQLLPSSEHSASESAFRIALAAHQPTPVSPSEAESNAESEVDPEPSPPEPNPDDTEEPSAPPKPEVTEFPHCNKPFDAKPSEAAREWNRRKAENKEKNSVIDELMGYVGLESVKRQFLDIKSNVDICKQQGRALNKERFNIVFQGNPGTGKTTIARLYAKFLHSIGVIGSSKLKETSGIKLCTKGSTGVKRMFKKMLRREGGGILFVDEAYQLTAPYTDGLGRQALDIVLTTMENEIGKIAAIFVGYRDEMESFYEHNPGLSSRIPYSMSFSDFTDAELWQILHDNINTQYGGKMKVEDGMDGLYMRVAVRRLAQARGNRGFGNARAVENLLGVISKRQTRRIAREKREGKTPDLFLFTREDMLGPEPYYAGHKSKAWASLQTLIGLESVKECVEGMLRMTQLNYRRELAEIKPFQFSLNQLFVGAPGTGKTTVAKLYGQILAEIGLLSRGDVVLKTPADFIGECLGKSEAKTRKILEATVGKVLVIDEAYMLDSGDGGKDQDKFRTAVIDTLVAMVQGVPGEDRCIILVGYEDKMIDMFHNVNPGLSRRFPIANPFRFENFSLPQLMDILEKKMGEQDLEGTPETMRTARDVLERSLTRPNFPNAGEIDILLSIAKVRYERRQALQPPEEQDFHGKLEPEDFDKDYTRGTKSHVNTLQELDGRVHQSIIEKLATYQAQSLGARRHGLKPRDQVPTNFVFKGPAGTGKTTTAEHMGKLYYNMGFLATPDVISCSAGELIGKFVGHTGPQTRRILQKAIGKVLFIDEAFRLCYGGEFAAQAVDEIIQFLTRPSNAGRIVVILAGYKRDMDLLMTMFPALSGLFHEDISFEVLEPAECITLLLRELRLKSVPIEPDFLTDPADPGYIKASRLFNSLRAMPDWASARDIKEVAKWIVNKFLEQSSHQDIQVVRAVTMQQVHDCIFKLIVHKRSRLLTLKVNANAALPTQPPIAS